MSLSEKPIFTTVHSGARRTSGPKTSLSLSWRNFVASSVIFRTLKNGETRARTWFAKFVQRKTKSRNGKRNNQDSLSLKDKESNMSLILEQRFKNTNFKPILIGEVFRNWMELSNLSEEKLIILLQGMNNFDEINFFMNNYQNKIEIFVKLTWKVLMRWKNWKEFKSQGSMNFRDEDWSDRYWQHRTRALYKDLCAAGTLQRCTGNPMSKYVKQRFFITNNWRITKALKRYFEEHAKEVWERNWMNLEMQTTLLNTYLQNWEQRFWSISWTTQKRITSWMQLKRLQAQHQKSLLSMIKAWKMEEDSGMMSTEDICQKILCRQTWKVSVHSEDVNEIVAMQDCKDAGKKLLELIKFDRDCVPETQGEEARHDLKNLTCFSVVLGNATTLSGEGYGLNHDVCELFEQRQTIGVETLRP